MLEHCVGYSYDGMIPNLPSFLDKYISQHNNSCLFTKILVFFSGRERIELLNRYELSPVIETTFEWLINSETPVAVQANCLDILFNLRHKCDWVEEELKSQVVFMLRDGTAAMQSRGKKLLEKLG